LDSDVAVLILSVDKNGEEQSSSQRKGELHGYRERSILTLTKRDTEHEELLRVGLACVSTNDLLNWTKNHLLPFAPVVQGECTCANAIIVGRLGQDRKSRNGEPDSISTSADLAPPRALFVNRSRERLNASLATFAIHLHFSPFAFRSYTLRLLTITRCPCET